MTAFWRTNERSNEDTIADAGPHALNGTSGPEVRTDRGHRGACRVFNGRHDSFIYVPYSTVLDTMGTLVIEAQILLDPDAPNAIQTIAARWDARPDRQSWILFLGMTLEPPPARPITKSEDEAKLLFALWTDRSAMPQVFAADHFQPWHDRTWNHVAVCVDGARISFYLNGRWDSSFPCLGRIRRSRAPLTIGNFLGDSYDMGPDIWYHGLEGTGFAGMIDEFRISPAARARAWAPPPEGR